MKIKTLIITVTIFFLLAIQLYAQNEESPIGKVGFSKGNCFIKHVDNNNYIKLDIVDPIFSLDTVKTEEDSRVDIELSDGSTISVVDNSEITIDQSALKKEKFTNLGVLYGTLHLFVRKLSNGSFNINTLLVTAGIRGTSFTISTRDDGAVLIDVKEGIVEVEDTNGKSSLNKGDIEMYTLSGEKKRLKGKIDYKKWRLEAIKKIKQNPDRYLNKMLEKERRIIERLKTAHSKLEEYRKNWITFLRRVKFLERKGMYKQEKKLIIQQIKKTRNGLIFIAQTRKQLIAIRSIIAITYRIEKNLGNESKSNITIKKIRREYAKINYIINRLRQTEKTLRKVLFYLNVKYYKLNTNNVN